MSASPSGESRRFAAFISYASENEAVALELRDLLEARGLACWFAKRDIDPGNEYAAEIIRGIEESASLVVLVSAAANLSPHVLREVEQSLRRGKPIFPLLLEKVRLRPSLDYYIAPIHWIRYGPEGIGASAEVLAKALRGDNRWRAQGMAPGITRRVRYSQSVFISSLAAGAVVALASGIALATYVMHERNVAQARTDASETSLGFISLSLEKPSDSASAAFHGVVSLFLYGADTPHSAVTLRLAGVHKANASLLDLSSAIPGGVGNGASQIEFTADSLDKTITACLSMPHPRLQVAYRVTQTFLTSTVESGDGQVRVQLSPAAHDVVERDDGRPCGVSGRRS